MNEAIKLQEGVTTSVLHATEELSPVVAVHEGVTTAVPEVVTVAPTKSHVRESQELDKSLRLRMLRGFVTCQLCICR